MKGIVESLLAALEESESNEREIAKQQAQQFLQALEQMYARSQQESLTSVTDIELSDNKIIILDIINLAESTEPIQGVTDSEVCAVLEPPPVFEVRPLDAETAAKQVLDLIREAVISAKIVEPDSAPTTMAV